MPRAHIHICVLVRFRVHILMCSHINTSTHSHIHIQICFYVLIQVCSYAFITVWKYDRITLYSYIDMHYDSSCFSSTCVTTIQKIVSQNRSAFRRALVQIARCVYVTRTRGKHAHFEHKNDKLSYADMWYKWWFWTPAGMFPLSFLRIEDFFNNLLPFKIE